MNYKIDKEGKPYIEGVSFPAGGGLDKRCSHNGIALYCHYNLKSREAIGEFLTLDGWKCTHNEDDLQIWKKGDTIIYFQNYSGNLFGYLTTEYSNAEKTCEYCPYCDTEVELDAELKVQECPNCGKYIVTCSMCTACDDEDWGCTDKCPLEHLANELNKDVKQKIDISDAERMVREMTNKEQIEDRVYELAQSLIDGYIKKVEDEHRIMVNGKPASEELGSGEEWYDEIKDDMMKAVFERISDWMKGDVLN